MNVYPEDFIKKHEVIEEIYSDDRYPDAMKVRNARARELRKVGWKVEGRTWNFIDLARCVAYSLIATRERR
ncbi:MAG: hypothetical protein ABIJ44_09070 [Pseudomonadota bacterium]